MESLSRRTLLAGFAVAAVGAVGVASASPAFAAGPSPIAGGSCVWQDGSNVNQALGPATSVEGTVVMPYETLSACSADLVQPFAAFTPVTSPFGVRIHPITGVRTMHYGTDFSSYGIRGTPIKSIADGVVYYKAESYATTGAGNTIIVSHANNVRSQYMHMGAPSSLAVGQRVSAGDVLGYVGSTGAATGPHLHLEVKVNGTNIDPAPYLAGAPFMR